MSLTFNRLRRIVIKILSWLSVLFFLLALAHGHPYWIALGLCLLYPIASSAAALKEFVRRTRRENSGCCPECGYDLRASVHRCPECGRTIPVPLPGTERKVRWNRLCAGCFSLCLAAASLGVSIQNADYVDIMPVQDSGRVGQEQRQQEAGERWFFGSCFALLLFGALGVTLIYSSFDWSDCAHREQF